MCVCVCVFFQFCDVAKMAMSYKKFSHLAKFGYKPAMKGSFFKESFIVGHLLEPYEINML